MIDATATLRDLTIGSGTVYELKSWPEELLSTPTIREDDESRPRANGVIAADDFYGSLPFAFNVQVNAGSLAASELALADLRAAFARSATDLTLDARVKGSPAEYFLRGRPRGVVVKMDRQRALPGLIDARCLFTATDPIKYGAAESVNIGLATPGTGLVYPVTYPVVYGGSPGFGIGSAPNEGSEAVDWTATLTGPLVNPRLELVETGEFIKLAATIAAGQFVELDSAARAILLLGTAPRPGWRAPASEWWQLAPGPNSVRFSADTGTGSAQINWRPGWA